MKIAIAVTMCNEVAYSQKMVSSIVSSTPYYLILVDDYSIDGTKKWTRSLLAAEKTQATHNRLGVEVIEDPDTDTLGAKWNLAMEKAKELGCDAVLVCNNDILFNPKTIDNLVARLELAKTRRENVVLVSAHNRRGSIEPEEILALDIPTNPTESEGPDFSCFLLDIQAWETVGKFPTIFKPCLSYDSKVLMADGAWESLGKLVYDKSTKEVVSFDETNQRFINSPINGWYENSYTGNWYKIISKYTKKTKWGYGGPYFTPDHLILTLEGWKEVSELSSSDKLLTTEKLLSKRELQLVLGSCLGDGSLKKINKSGTVFFQVGHCKAQNEYLEFKAGILGRIKNYDYTYFIDGTQKEINGRTVTVTDFSLIRTVCLRQLADIYALYYPNNKRLITRKFLDMLGPEAVAYWYLDNGNLATNRYAAITVGKQHTIKEIEILTSWLKDSFDITTKIVSEHVWRLRFSAENSAKLFDLISEYVPESMNYKLPAQYKYSYKEITEQTEDAGYYYEDFDRLVEMKTQKFYNKCESRMNKSYCLDVSGTHNFVTLSGIVHNCYFEDNFTHAMLKLRGLKAVATTAAPYYHYGSVTQNSVIGGLCKPPQFEENRAVFQKYFGVLPDEVDANLEEIRARLNINVSPKLL